MAEHEKVIEISPEVCHGTPVFAGFVPVKTLFDYLKGGDTLAEFLDDFRTVSQEQAVKALELAGEDLIDEAVDADSRKSMVAPVEDGPMEVAPHQFRRRLPPLEIAGRVAFFKGLFRPPASPAKLATHPYRRKCRHGLGCS